MLYAYSKVPVSVLMTHKDIMWGTAYVQHVIQENAGKIKNVRSKSEYLEASKMCSLAFARAYGLGEQWKELHLPFNLYQPFHDFTGHGHKLRLCSVPMREDRNLGTEMRGRVFEKDFDKGHTGYVLCAWYPPYVDLIGWIPKDELKTKKVEWVYVIEESAVRPMKDLSGFKLVI